MKNFTKIMKWSVFVFLIFQTVSAQIKIGNNPTVINPSAILEIESTNKGFLLPRLQLTDSSLAAPLLQHVAGMLVYNIANTNGLAPGFYYNDGTKWISISQSTATGLLSADNGLTNVSGVAKLGGNLTQPTVLTTTTINTLAIQGLGMGNTSQGDFVLIDKLTGVLKTIPYSFIEEALNKKLDSNTAIVAGTNTKITYDEKGLIIKGENTAIQDIGGLQTELDKKSTIDSPVFTGTPKTTPVTATSSADAIANKGYVDGAIIDAKTSEVSQTITDGQTTTAPSENTVYDALTQKTDKTYVDTQDALKADKVYVDSQDALKADKTYVDTQNALKADITYVDSQDALKADKTYVDSQDALKADKTYVDTQDALKADITYVDSQDALKGDKTYVDSQDALKADKTYVDSQDALKADKTYVDTQNALKADITYVDSHDALKADKTYVDSQDLLKADKTYVDAQNAQKANITYVDAKVEDQIIDGEVTKAPSQNSVYDALSTKIDSNPVITGGSNTKITYDAKGLITKGEIALITDIQGLQTELNRKAPTDSPLFTGTPKTIPINITSSANSIVNKSYVDDLVSQSQSEVISQTITDGQTFTAPSENAVYDALALKAPTDSPTFTGLVRTVTPTATSDEKTITTKEYVDAKAGQVATDLISQTVLLGDTTTAPSEDAVRKELDLKAPINAPVFTGIAQVPDIATNSITDPLAITNKGYVDAQITAAGNIYTKDGILTDNRKVTLDGKNLDFVGSTINNPTRLAADGNMTVGGNININNKVAGINTPINALYFTNDEEGAGYAAASITAKTGDDKGKGQLSFNVKTATGVDTEALGITDKGNVLIGDTPDDNTAVLNVQSTSKGMLMPRQTKAERDLIATPATGLQVYQTDNSGTSLEGQYLKTSTGWSRILLEGDVKLDYFEAINTSGGTISGSTTVPIAVHISGVNNSNIKNITISDAATTNTARFDGVVIANVPAGALCKVYLRYVSFNSNTSAFAQNSSIFLGTGGSFTDDPSSLPFGVNIGKVLDVNATNGAILFTVYPVTDFFRNQYERINGGSDETVFTGRVSSSLEPLDDTYLTNKKYVDQAIAFSQLYQGGWDAATNNPPLEAAPVAKNGWTYDVIVASGGTVNYPNMCASADILKGYSIKFNGTCWVVLEKQFPSATTTQEGMVKLDTSISASNTLVPTSNILKQVSDVIGAHINDKNDPHDVTKDQIGLGNADDTSDINKPVSGPQQTAINLKADKANGAAQLTDGNAYGNIGTLAGATQANINTQINNQLGSKTQLNGNGLVRMAGTTVSYDNIVYAPLASPVFTGDALAVTPQAGDNDTSIATTSFVTAAASDFWSKNGNDVLDTDFIGSVNNKNLVFKAFNIERMRIDNSLAQVNIGATSSPTKFRINTSSELFKNEALTIITDDPNPLYMTFQAFGSGPETPYFDISSYIYDNINFKNIPANISILSEGGILSVGKDDFTGLSERLEVNGNVQASGFKIPSGTSSQFLMADGSTSAGPVANGWSLNGNEITTGNFIGSTNNEDIIFKTNNKERWRMGSDTGRFYIGDLADPNSAGSLYIVTEGGTTNSIPLTIKTADLDNPLTMLFQTDLSGSSKYFKISNFIGDTNTPANLALMPEGGILNLGYFDFTGLSEKLEVNGTVRATGFKTLNGTAGQYLMADGSVSSLTSNGWSLTGNTGTTPGANFIGTTDNKDLVFKANNIERIRVNNGNGKLSIGDNQNPGSVLITTSSTASTAPLSIMTNDFNPLVLTFQDLGVVPNNFFSIDAFRVGNLNVPANISLLPTGGILGVGYSDYTGLTEKVEVNGYVKAEGFKIPGGTSFYYLMSDGSVSRFVAGWDLTGNANINPATDFIGTVDNNSLVFKTNNTQRLLVASSGGVFVNEDAVTGYQFHVNGNVGGSQGWSVVSDKRLKTNIQPVEHGLSKVLQMKPMTYDKKASLASNDYNIQEIGFIAQDLKLLFPKGVINEGKDKDKLLSVNYTELIPVLTKAIQEQQKIIEKEKAKNDKQEKEIDELKTMVKQLMERK